MLSALRILTSTILVGIFINTASPGQVQTTTSTTKTFSNPELVPITLVKVSAPLKDQPEHPPTLEELKGPRPVHDNPSLERPRPKNNKSSLPLGPDPALQKEYNNGNERQGDAMTTTSILSTWNGLTAAVEPSDATLAVGPNHVVQMTNNKVSTFIRIWNKAGTVVAGNKLISDITGIIDYGDPNILYDQIADKFVFVVLYSHSQKKLVVCVSTSPDPNGSYYTYTFATPDGFPDYPKIALWGNSYIITTNSKDPTIYALNRSAMLTGAAAGNAQMFLLSKFPKISFQAASPISHIGSTPPPAGSPAMVMRVADSDWGVPGADHLELFALNIDWNNTANSSITGPINLPTIAYNSNLCGYSSGNCIPQPGSSIYLDPLSDIVMDKVQYRNMGSYEAIVCSHVCNAFGNGIAGVRWYELRRTGNGSGWYIYQQSTYAPSAEHRWMSSISMNQSGTIALGYNISSYSTYPGLRITGRDTCSALNTMTVPETVVINGTASNNSIRYGDYSGLVTDPVDNSFWFTGSYNPSPDWSTSVVHFTFNSCPINKEVAAADNRVNVLRLVPNPATDEVRINYFSGSNTTMTLQIFDIAGKMVEQQVKALREGENSFTVDVRPFETGYYFVRASTDEETTTQKLLLQR